IKFILDTTLSNEKKSKVQITQGNRILKAYLNEAINVKLKTELTVDFITSDLLINGFKRLKIFSDTSIIVGATALATVVVKSKKKVISENTQGFDYYPQNDSSLREKSILMGLQRLPFINGYDNQTVPTYRQDGKILFTINGKQRQGIENNWEAILRIVKGKDVYKVELIEEIPIQIKNQGYAAIINILTLEANIYGNSFNTVLFYDQRNNINTSASATFLRKRFDISMNVGRDEDNQKGNRKTEVFNNNILHSVLDVKSKYIFETKYANIDIGFRKDSLRDFGLNVSAQSTAYSTKYTPIYQSGLNTIGITNKLKKENVRANFSYIFRKKKGLTFSIITATSYAIETKGNNLAYYTPKQTDSAAVRTPSNELYWVAEYNIQDTRNQKYQKEFGIKIYNRDLTLDFNRYTINNNNNELGQLLYNKNDSFTTNQYSLRPYIRWANNISKTKRLTVSFFPELYVIKNSSVPKQQFFVPNLTIGYRKILNSINSLRYSFIVELLKPNIDYLSTVQVFNDPQQQQVGNVRLRPSKYFNGGGEWVRRKKSTFSYGVNIVYAFDQYDFFRTVNPTTSILQSFANNGLKSYRFLNNVNYQKQLSKTIWVDASGGAFLNLNRNKLFNSAYDRVTLNNQSNIRFEFGENKGTLTLRLFFSTNPTNGQGYAQGTRMYGLSYSNQLFKKKLAITFIADQFLLKNRNRLNFTKSKEFEVFTNTTEPYRLLKIRLSYRFSDIKISKMAIKKSTEISGEMQRAQ
ncbi:MAG: outer membrane beta-barrel protein, partial [Ferruginibacter sp.]